MNKENIPVNLDVEEDILQKLKKLNIAIIDYSCENDEKSNKLQNIDLSMMDNDKFAIFVTKSNISKVDCCADITHYFAINEKKTVALFGFEPHKKDIVNQLLCGLGKIDATKLNEGSLEHKDWENLQSSAKILDKTPIYIDDASDINLNDIKSQCDELKDKKGLDLIIADYLQLLKEKENIENITKDLKNMAKELDVQIIAIL